MESWRQKCRHIIVPTIGATTFNSFQLIPWANAIVRCPSSVRPSVCPSVTFCANRFFYHRNGWIATKLAHDGPQKSPHPGCAQGQCQGQRSRDRDTFVISRKSLLLAGGWLDRHQTSTWWSPEEPASTMCSRSKSRSKVTWYGHFCDVTKCLLYSTVSSSVSTCAHFIVPLYSPSSTSIRQLDLM